MAKLLEKRRKANGTPGSITGGYLGAFLCLSIALSDCGGPAKRSASFRYKLTLSVNTSEGVKTASNVVELDYESLTFPSAGTPHKVHGQGLYLDLGPGRPPLIAMLTRIRRHNDDPTRGPAIWWDDSPAYIFAKYCHIDEMSQIDMVERLQNCRYPINLTSDELPELVTFSDIQNLDSAKSVKPNNITESLGEGISWRSRTLEISKERVTSDITDHISVAPLRDKFVRLNGVDACCGYPDGIILFELVRK